MPIAGGPRCQFERRTASNFKFITNASPNRRGEPAFSALQAERERLTMAAREAPIASPNDEPWVEEVAHLLLNSGFRPDHKIGQVKHAATPHRTGRTFGSVWHAMRGVLERAPE